MTSKKTTCRIPDELLEHLSARAEPGYTGGISEALRESLSRYFTLLDRARANLQGRFNAEELANICQLGNATWFEAHSLDGLSLDADDALEDEVPCPEALVSVREKLQQLTLTEHAALVDAVERYWRACGTGMQIDISHLLD